MKNRSMLDEAAIDGDKLTENRFEAAVKDEFLKRYRVFAPVGHIYSVMVEEAEIKSPNLSKFVDELNGYIRRGGNAFACVGGAMDHISPRAASSLHRYLADHVSRRRISKEAAINVMKAATGCDPSYIRFPGL